MAGGRPTRAEVDLDRIAHNVTVLRRLTRPGTAFMAVVKADGYGHGAAEVAAVALEHGATWLGVAIPEEALALRAAGIGAPILVLGPILPHQAAMVVAAGARATVSGVAEARALGRAARAAGREPAVVHLKVDTGMGRIGLLPDEAGAERALQVAGQPGVSVEGIFTHFAAADEADKGYTRWQLDRFFGFLEVLARRGLKPAIRHAANSAGLLEVPESHLDLVRVGIALYGLFPSPEVRREVDLRPALRLVTAVAQVRTVPAGTRVSYGCTWQAGRDTVLAVLPAGYADGYRRALGNRAQVLVGGRRAPVVGHVCMDQTIVDVGDLSGVAPGDEAVLLGEQSGDRITADELAEHLGTINYEVVTGIGRRVPRVYLRGGRPAGPPRP